MELKYDPKSKRYYCLATFDERSIPKAAAFWWNHDDLPKVWSHHDPLAASKLIQYADAETHALLDEIAARRTETLAASKATNADIEIPAPEGLSYLPFQKAGVAFISSRPNVLLADQMGLGKTIQVLGAINADPKIRRILIVCPASLRLNWEREANKWLVRPMSIELAVSDAPLSDRNITIINYDILKRHKEQLGKIVLDLLVVDECHYCKNPKAQRTQLVTGLKAKRKVLLTGTPIVNRPVELFPIINFLDPITWPKFFPFAKRYADARHNGYGWDFKGASHLNELQEKLRSTIMIRRLKDDVLRELPPKRRVVVEVEADAVMQKAIDKELAAHERSEQAKERLRAEAMDAEAFGDQADYNAAVSRLRDTSSLLFEEMSAARHETALSKVPAVITHVKNILDDDETYKIVIFAHHKDVIALIREAFGDKAVVLTGDSPPSQRQLAVDRFQTDPSVQVFIGSITAAGVGITLTASAHVVFAELDWVPGNVTQAEDRTHRIGQRNSVLIEHLVVDKSLDARLAKAIVKKQAVIDQSLDQELASLPVLPDDEPSEKPVSASVSRQEHVWSFDQVVLIQSGLRLLAGLDADRAGELNGQGFNRVDTNLGHKLAELTFLSPKQAAVGMKMLHKYRRQLGDLVSELEEKTV